MGRADSRLVPRDRRYSRFPAEVDSFRLRGYHPLWPGFPAGSTTRQLGNSVQVRNHCSGSHNPTNATPAGLHIHGLGSSLFARRYWGNRGFSFLSCGYLDGSVPCVPYRTLWIHVRLTGLYPASFPNLGHPRIKDCLRLPEAFRSLATSFVGSWCLGILTYTLSSLI